MKQYELRPRGLGINSGKCFVCGKYVSCGTDFSSFVPSKEHGERIIQFISDIGYNAWLDYRDNEPNYVQVKIVGCDNHEEIIKKLYKLISENNSLDAGKIIDAIRIDKKSKSNMFLKKNVRAPIPHTLPG